MQEYYGQISKLESDLKQTIQYSLPIGKKNKIPLNNLIGNKLFISFDGKIECVACGQKLKKPLCRVIAILALLDYHKHQSVY